MTRQSGVLLHITSLPGSQGIGTLGKVARQFVDFLVQTGQTFWQILPLGPTGYGNSPYQAYSAFAGNIQLIDLETLQAEGLLMTDWKPSDPHSEYVDFDRIIAQRRPLLEEAVRNFLKQGGHTEYQTFLQTNQHFVQDFAVFMALKEHYDGKAWDEWPAPIRNRQPQALEQKIQTLQPHIDFHLVTQYFFHRQWKALKTYANDRHIQFIGDLPFYVSYDSVEMWTHPELFKVDDDNHLAVVAGTPPDYFAEDGQLWGNPIYDWDFHRATNYDWWVQRLEDNLTKFDYVRIDHFRGFEAFWEIPATDDTALNGYWVKGPDREFFDVVKERIDSVNIIAEDLGLITPAVEDLLAYTGFPGMNVLQFAFDGSDNKYLPHNFHAQRIGYVGTHDNNTTEGWWASEGIRHHAFLNTYLPPYQAPISTVLNRVLAATVAQTVIYTMQDLLALGSHARMNTPGTVGDNWNWRLTTLDFAPEVIDELTFITRTYFRWNQEKAPQAESL